MTDCIYYRPKSATKGAGLQLLPEPELAMLDISFFRQPGKEVIIIVDPVLESGRFFKFTFEVYACEKVQPHTSRQHYVEQLYSRRGRLSNTYGSKVLLGKEMTGYWTGHLNYSPNDKGAFHCEISGEGITSLDRQAEIYHKGIELIKHTIPHFQENFQTVPLVNSLGVYIQLKPKDYHPKKT